MTTETEALQKFRDSIEPGAFRLFLGKHRNKSVALNIRDRKGNLRLHLGVDSLGTPKLDFLNEKGEITYSLPDSAHIAAKQR